MLVKTLLKGHYAGTGRDRAFTDRYDRGQNRYRKDTEDSRAEEGYSFVAYLSHLNIDNTPLPRRNTVLAPSRDTATLWAAITFFSFTSYVRMYIFKIAYCTLPPSCVVLLAHHLSTRTANVFTLVSTVVY